MKKLQTCIAHYEVMKANHPNVLLLFRVGDFYECYNEDAVITSEVLGITLTTCKPASAEQPASHMAGFPHHALQTYLPRLVRAGQRVAICEQLYEESCCGNCCNWRKAGCEAIDMFRSAPCVHYRYRGQ